MKKTLFTAFFTLIFFGLTNSAVFAGIGVTPVNIENNRLRPGTTYTRELVLSQSDPEEALLVTIEPDFGELNSWFSFEPGREFTVEAGVQRVTMTVNINVPQDADINPVDGAIRIKVSPENQVAAPIQVERGVKIDVSLATTNDSFVEFLVRSIDISDVNENGFAEATVRVENTGNVMGAPSRLLLNVLSLEEEPVDSFSLTGFEMIAPGQVGESNLSFDARGLEPGEYFVDAQVLQDSDVLRQERLVINVPESEDVSAASDTNSQVDNSVGDLNRFLEENRLLALMLVVLIATSFTALIIFLYRNSEERELEDKKAKA